MRGGTKDFRRSVEQKLRSNGYYTHNAEQRTHMIQKAFSQIDNATKGLSLKNSVQDYLGR